MKANNLLLILRLMKQEFRGEATCPACSESSLSAVHPNSHVLAILIHLLGRPTVLHTFTLCSTSAHPCWEALQEPLPQTAYGHMQRGTRQKPVCFNPRFPPNFLSLVTQFHRQATVPKKQCNRGGTRNARPNLAPTFEKGRSLVCPWVSHLSPSVPPQPGCPLAHAAHARGRSSKAGNCRELCKTGALLPWEGDGASVGHALLLQEQRWEDLGVLLGNPLGKRVPHTYSGFFLRRVKTSSLHTLHPQKAEAEPLRGGGDAANPARNARRGDVGVRGQTYACRPPGCPWDNK